MFERNEPVFDSFFWFQWIMATTLGWILGSLLLPYIPTIAAGVGVGAMQWPVLRHRISRAWRWPVITAGTWIGVSILMQIAVPAELQFLVSGLILGPSVGLAQWLILRRQVYWAGWWIVISTIAWITGLTLLPGTLSTGALAGALSGLAMALLLHYPRPSPAADGMQATN